MPGLDSADACQFRDTRTLNIIAFSLLSLIEALQFLIVVAFIYSFIPLPPALNSARHARDILFYHIWIATGLGLQGVLVFLNRRRLGEDRLWRGTAPYTCTMAALVMIQIFAIFKIFLWGNPWWARGLLYVLMGIGLAGRIFWPEFWRLICGFWARWTAWRIPWYGPYVMDMGVIFILIVLVFTPDLNAVLASMFSSDKFYHLDSFIMAPAWAHHNGLVLNKEVTSEYSLIIPLVIDGLMTLAGGFSYAHAVGIMIGLCAVYYFLLYGLWRYWLGSVGLSFLAVIFCIKLQFFHWGVMPLIWTYPSATPLRYFPDVFFLFFILRFTQELRLRWLVAAAITSGLALVWTIDVGVYMFVSLLAAIIACTYLRGLRFLPKAVVLALIPWSVALGILSILYGGFVWQADFWHHITEFAMLFIQGWGALPITDGLINKQFFAFCAGFMIPAAYAGTLLYSLGMFLFRRSQPHLLMILICIYGLGSYHYFIHRSAVTSYYVVVVPLIFVLLFWLQSLLGLCPKPWRKGIKLLLCVWALTALTTGYWFTYYPNHLNLSGFDWSSEKNFYARNFDFIQDASLIDAFTAAQEPVALISSFETKILMQADRRPFFYYFPLVGSQHMQDTDRMNGTYLHTYARLTLTLQQLQDKRPLHLFVQTNLFKWKGSPSYDNSRSGLKQLLAYIYLHYQYQAQGRYLTVLTRTE